MTISTSRNPSGVKKWTTEDFIRVSVAVDEKPDDESIASVARRIGVPEGSINYMATRGRALRGAEAPSLRSATLALIKEEGPIADSRDIPRMLKVRGFVGRVDLHSVQHIIGALIRSADIEGHHIKNGSFAWYTEVGLRSTAASRASVADEPEAPAEAGAEATEISESAEVEEASVQPETVAETDDSLAEREALAFPILTELRARRQASVEARRRADAYLGAALLVEDVDADLSATLTARAESTAASITLSRVEAEYLAYADSVEESDR